MKNIKVKGRITYGWAGSPGVAFTVTAEIENGKRAVVRVVSACTEHVHLRLSGRVLLNDKDYCLNEAERADYWKQRHAEYDRVCKTFQR